MTGAGHMSGLHTASPTVAATQQEDRILSQSQRERRERRDRREAGENRLGLARAAIPAVQSSEDFKTLDIVVQVSHAFTL